ncbi:MAG: acetoacetate--CoA ligase [Candidatus Promineifilaceae bacterium]|nr:acetoacetate--CoA ligase [Candidatus Promineifilaceae bacterium]
MGQVEEGTKLWEPGPLVRAQSNMRDYMDWLQRQRGLAFDDYWSLWHWSVDNVRVFWRTIWDYFDIRASKAPDEILSSTEMPGVEWFTGARMNYAENFFARADLQRPALIFRSESGPGQIWTWDELHFQTGRLAQQLVELGVEPGDRVAAFMPNIPEAIVGLLATASIGAVWSSCSPDFGPRSVLDRFQQIEPKVLLAVDGYRYGGTWYDRREVLAELRRGLPSLEAVILIPLLPESSITEAAADLTIWDDILVPDASSAGKETPLHFEQVSFDHPLWVLYSSGTTGKPKPIVHGHGGILLEHLKMTSLHLDLKAGDRFFWYTSTGWMMWNFLVGGLLAGCTIVVYDGSPGHPDLYALWQLAAETGITYFGTSAAFIEACMKANLNPNRGSDLTHIRAVGSTGSPLSPEGFAWIYEHVDDDLAVESVSGGTDLCTAFVGGIRLLPVRAGEIQGPMLGADVAALDESGNEVVDQVGELVIRQPMPSMPLYFWGDDDGKRYRASYFQTYPGIWRHGDWVKFKRRGSCVIYGRSDSTINRHGVRMGTSEIYQVVEALPEIADSLVVDLEMLGRESHMALFIVLRAGVSLDGSLEDKIRRRLRIEVSPRHVPDEIYAIDEVPYTLSGKKMEVPVRRILLGTEPKQAANPGAMRSPKAIDYFVELARRYGTSEPT